MDKVILPYHLAIPAIISLIGLFAILFYRKNLFAKNKLVWISIMVFFITYLYFVGSATYETVYYQWNLNSYDLDKDGMFSGREITEEQKEAMKKLANDTGRNFSFITGFVFALIVSAGVYVAGKIIVKFQRQ